MRLAVSQSSKIGTRGSLVLAPELPQGFDRTLVEQLEVRENIRISVSGPSIRMMVVGDFKCLITEYYGHRKTTR